MHVRVVRLRRHGARIEVDRHTPRTEGHLRLDEDRRVKKLTLCGLRRGAFEGDPIDVLYEPQLVRLGTETFTLRGVERVELGVRRSAGYVQEWLIEVRWLPDRIGPPLGEVKPSTPYPPAPFTGAAS